ncbi:MAG: histidinol-phosphate phosphatase [Proteobacteria bacterium]|nr:histidinol-phosphate phosphatase [Pseudomonadota bacterium]
MKLIILDRDGVINVFSDQFIKSPDEWKPIPGSLEAIARLTREGWRVVVATNQSGLARGLFEMATLNAIHAKMHKAVMQAGGRIEAVFFCPHSADWQTAWMPGRCWSKPARARKPWRRAACPGIRRCLPT